MKHRVSLEAIVRKDQPLDAQFAETKREVDGIIAMQNGGPVEDVRYEQAVIDRPTGIPPSEWNTEEDGRIIWVRGTFDAEWTTPAQGRPGVPVVEH